ncbi:MAG: hypothetical protein ACXVAX_04420 [Pseudobdellovibrio sp.]
MNKKYLKLLLVFFVAGCTQPKQEMQIPDIHFEKSEFIQADFSESKPSAPQVSFKSYESSDNKEVLKVLISENSLDEAKKIINQKSTDIKLLFATQQVPYFGQVTKEMKCTEAVDLKNPLIENENEVSLFLNLTATHHFVYGSCLEDQEIYKSQLLYLYCKKSRKLFELKYFYPKNLNYKKQIAHCQ